jgi:2-keto-4-pentenoate hydratase/2-oxohepta-3-ene-1,7-dioic acid hydratase in catechol pathway
MRLAVLRFEDYLAPVIFHQAQAFPVWELAPDAPESWSGLIAWLHQPAHRAQVLAAIPSAIALPQPYHFVPPIAPSNRILCVGLNYREHAAEGKQAVQETPVFFIRFPSSFVGHRGDLIAPKLSSKYDYEAELAVIIGQEGRYLTRENALAHVFGYSIGFDGSVRDYQKRTPQWTLGKNFDESGALGPELVSADELPPGAQGLRVQTILNGQIMQDGNTSDMIFDIPTLLIHLSEVMTLEPGDVILTGTPAGVGFARTPPVYLKPGDSIETVIEGLGTLKNAVVAEGNK